MWPRDAISWHRSGSTLAQVIAQCWPRSMSPYGITRPQGIQLLYIPRNMHTVFALLCFVVVIHWLIFPYPSGLLHWHCGNLTIAPVPAKQPWWIWINTSCEFIMNDCITTTKQSTTKPCAYFLGYTVCAMHDMMHDSFNYGNQIAKSFLTRNHCLSSLHYFIIDIFITMLVFSFIMNWNINLAWSYLTRWIDNS